MAFNRDQLQPGETRQCTRCGASIRGARAMSGDVIAVETGPAIRGTVWVGENEAGTIICAQLGGPLLELAREQGIALKHFHVHLKGE